MTSVLKHGINPIYKYGIRNLFGFTRKKFNLGTCNLVELGNVSAELDVPEHITKPPYFYDPEALGEHAKDEVEIKNSEDIQAMRKSCKLAASILKSCGNIIKPGITTDEIDKFVHRQTIESNAYPSPLHYRGFPKSVCTSVNNVACHGIPDDRPLLNGDIVNVDVTVYYQDFHGDCSYTFQVGHVDERGKFLVETTKKCLDETIKLCGPNRPFYLIGNFIEKFAKKHELDVVPAFIGHGIGNYFHGPPEVLHFENNIGGCMLPGMTFTIEPILTLGDREIEIQEDGWTAMSVDNSRSAQFEHTVLITDDGVEILTE